MSDDRAKLAKAKTAKARRIIRNRLPKLVENPKQAVFIKGPKTSDILKKTMLDLYKLKQPLAKMMQKKNITRPFEDHTTVEFLGKANDASLFGFGSHSKKRPHNLILGRLFDFTVLDMMELSIDGSTLKTMKDFRGTKASVRYGSKPFFLFQGEEFENNGQYALFKSLILDFFRGEVIPKINLVGISRIIICTAIGGKVLFRHYRVSLKLEEGSKLPKVELFESGPSIDFKIGRVVEAPADIRKRALQVPKELKPRKQKNIEQGTLGETLGRIHLGRQEIDKLQTRKVKALKRKRGGDDGESEAGSGSFKGEGPRKKRKGAAPEISTTSEFA